MKYVIFYDFIYREYENRENCVNLLEVNIVVIFRVGFRD